jgi:threonyl-tRNA synthetase
MIHRALYGAIERFVGVLVEHFAGAFPTWLSPVQSVIIPIADRHLDYARKVNERLLERLVRCEVDDSDNTLGAKIRHQQLLKVPYMLIVGDDEASSDTVSLRRRNGEEERGVPVGDSTEKLTMEITERRVEPSL